MNNMEAGVDEAGRGPVIGPMVVACVVLDSRSTNFLRRIVRDSKLMAPIDRRRAYSLILRVAREVKIRVVEPWEIDEAVEGRGIRNLNYLEALIAASLINSLELRIEKVYLDSPDPVPERYAEIVKRYLSEDLRGRVEVVAANNAEHLYVHVAAASIVAKVRRDELVAELRRVYGDFGSGYPSDPKTRAFLVRLLKEGGRLPPIVRRSWQTLRKLREEVAGATRE